MYACSPDAMWCDITNLLHPQVKRGGQDVDAKYCYRTEAWTDCHCLCQCSGIYSYNVAVKWATSPTDRVADVPCGGYNSAIPNSHSSACWGFVTDIIL